ncbi:MAG: hypothetical protein MSG64_06355 [Pyrinomonadaceae bacterium MAG19_C2-C3]|nr:hypothetical protein [Pyrinomonadaceae bacterium MAG19_C2-C3]
MAFGKNYQKDLSFDVIDARHPGEIFTFHIVKRASQDAVEAQLVYIGLPDEEAVEVKQAALIAAVGKLVSRAPEGFDGFPEDDRPLETRFVEYFSNPDVAEFPGMIRYLWEDYMAVGVPTVYLKSVQDISAGVGAFSDGLSTPSS